LAGLWLRPDSFQALEHSAGGVYQYLLPAQQLGKGSLTEVGQRVRNVDDRLARFFDDSPKKLSAGFGKLGELVLGFGEEMSGEL